MKKLLSVIFSIFIVYVAYNQNSNIEDKLLARYNQDYLENIKTNNPEILDYMKFFESNGYYFIKMDDKNKTDQLPVLKAINKNSKLATTITFTDDDLNDFNIFKYDYKQAYDKRTLYKLPGTDKILVILSKEEVAKKFNKK